MDQYDIAYNQQIVELLPPDKRYKNIVSYLTDCCLSTVQFLRDSVLGDYRLGSTAAQWSNTTSYPRGSKVMYKNAVFVSLVDNNNDTPTADTWYMQQQFFIGLDERLAYNGNNLILTYALNKWFGTTFRQPADGLSDIYITTNVIENGLFQIGYSEFESSEISYEGSPDGIGYSDTALGPQYNATFYVPNSLITSLGTAAIALLQSFINMYVYSGIVYNIVGYA